MFDELLLAQFLSRSFAKTCVQLRFLSCIILPWSNPLNSPNCLIQDFNIPKAFVHSCYIATVMSIFKGNLSQQQVMAIERALG